MFVRCVFYDRLMYYETSATNGYKIEEAVSSLLGCVMTHVDESGLPNSDHRITVINGDIIKWTKCEVDSVEQDEKRSKCFCWLCKFCYITELQRFYLFSYGSIIYIYTRRCNRYICRIFALLASCRAICCNVCYCSFILAFFVGGIIIVSKMLYEGTILELYKFLLLHVLNVLCCGAQNFCWCCLFIRERWKGCVVTAGSSSMNCCGGQSMSSGTTTCQSSSVKDPINSQALVHLLK